MMKWRVRRTSSVDADDVKSSLDLLDSVLAEYDDEDEELANCFSEWHYSPNESIRFTDILRCSSQNGEHGAEEDVYSNSTSPVDCQIRRRPPPVVPKRNPETRLSTHIAKPSPATDLQNSRPLSFPANSLSTFGVGSLSYPPPSHPPNVVPVTLSRSKTLPSDFRQSLHFDVYLSSEIPPRKPEQKRNSLKKRWSRKLW